MFIKKTRGGSKKNPIYYLQIVHSYRKDGKVKQKVICTLGREDQLDGSDQLDNIIKVLSDYSKNLIVMDTNRDNVQNIMLFGTSLVVNAMWEKMSFTSILAQLNKKYKFEFNLNNVMKTLVINRLSDPKSKLAIEKWQENVYGIDSETVELQHIYRTLDYLAENKDIIEKHLYETTTGLFKSEVSVVFYDLTTIYLESQKEDDLKKFGYSKENKTDCVQVVIGLIINEDGMPLGYEMFPGNTFEGKTVCKMLDKLQTKFMLRQLIFVADKGILSENILTELESRGYEYIVSAKLSQTPTGKHPEILDKSRYTKINEDILTAETEIKSRRLILGYSSHRANRDKSQREALLGKLSAKIEKSGINAISKPQYNKYLEKTGKVTVKLSEEKICNQAKWDGFFGFYTNCRMNSVEIVNSYRMLWQIEDSFRTLKSTLNVRPMYHWTDKRIEGHIMLCFIALYVLRSIEFYTKQAGLEYSPRVILESLMELKAIKLNVANKSVIVRNEITGKTNEVLRALKIKIPSMVLEKEQV